MIINLKYGIVEKALGEVVAWSNYFSLRDLGNVMSRRWVWISSSKVEIKPNSQSSCDIQHPSKIPYVIIFHKCQNFIQT